MNTGRTVRTAASAVPAIVIALAFAAQTFAQYTNQYITAVVQQQVRTRIVNDLRGSGHEVAFDNNAVVLDTNNRDQRRVAGSGRHRFNNQAWRVFNYEGTFNMRSGFVTGVDYQFSNDYDNGGPGDSRADMTWSGNVDDRVTISIRGGTAFSKGRTPPRPDPTGVRYNFRNPLPSRPVQVSVRKIEGRGSVEIVQQPNAINAWTALVVISDPRGGADRYTLEFDWERGGGRPPIELPGPGNGRINWSGEVDGIADLIIQRDRVDVRNISGSPVRDDAFNVRDELPRRDVTVRANRRDGRGDVNVIQQPTNRNNYTAIVRINDPRAGSDRYFIEVNWGDETPPIGTPGFGNGKINWRGRVDDTVDITVRQNRVTARAISGAPLRDDDSNVREALPRRGVEVSVNRRDGRGEVNVIQQPSNLNDYTAVIRIRDGRAGNDFYSVEIDWDNFDGRPEGSKMTWRGRVDATGRISVNGRNARVTTISGQTVTVDKVSFSEALPRRGVRVNLTKREGRGDVRIVQQPNLFNGFTAIIEISDPRAGSDVYEFDLDW